MKIFAGILAVASAAAILCGAQLPRKAPELTVALPDKKVAKLSDCKGKVTIVTFILSTCPHCQNTTRILNGVEKDLGPKGLCVLSGIINDDADIPDFIRRFQPAFPVGAVDRMTAAGIMQIDLTKRAFVPFMLFIDRKGVIQAQYTGGDEFLSKEDQEDAHIREEAAKLLGGKQSKNLPPKKG